MSKKESSKAPIEIKSQADCLIVKVNQATLSENEIQITLGDIKNKADESEMLIFDLLATKEITPGALQLLSLVIGSTQQRKERTAFLMSDALKKKVGEMGFLNVFPIFSDKKNALKNRAFEIRPDAINFLNYVREAVFDVIKTHTKSEASAGAMYKRQPGRQPQIDIAGVIAIFEKNYQATIILGFEKACYLELMGKMHSKVYKNLEPEIHDGAAELISQIVDNAKLRFGKQGHAIEKSIASIAVGGGFQIFLEKNTSIIVPISTSFGNMVLEMAARPPA